MFWILFGYHELTFKREFSKKIGRSKSTVTKSSSRMSCLDNMLRSKTLTETSSDYVWLLFGSNELTHIRSGSGFPKKIWRREISSQEHVIKRSSRMCCLVNTLRSEMLTAIPWDYVLTSIKSSSPKKIRRNEINSQELAIKSSSRSSSC